MDEPAKQVKSPADVDSLAAWVEAMYTRYATDVLRVSYFYLGDRHKAEDVTQDVFLRLMENRPSLKEGSEKSWLLKVALNRCRDLWRTAWFRRVLVGSPALELVPSPDPIENHIEKEALMQAIHSLPVESREVFLLYYYQGYSISEIAGILEVAEGTVSSRLSRGRHRLRTLIEGGNQG